MEKVFMIYSNETTNDVSIIGEFNSSEAAYENMMLFLESCNYRSYTQRYMQFDGYTKIDFGSHTQFYYEIIGNKQDAEALVEMIKNKGVY